MNNERMQLTYLDVFNNLNAKNIYASGVNTNQLDLNSIDILSISGVDISIISGNVTLTNRPTVNGTGVVLSGELNPIIVNTGSLLNNKINSLSGYVNSQDVIFSGQIASTGSSLYNSILSLSGLFTGYTGNLDSNFASDAQLFTTGSILDNKINSLSGYVNTQDIIFSGQTFNTGSRLDNKINSLSGYVNAQDIIFSGQISSSGSSLYNSILSLSGLFTGYTGFLDTNFASDSQLFTTGSTLDNKVNSLSGYVNSRDSLFSGQTATTGSRLDNKINSLSGVSVLKFGDQNIGGNKTFTGITTFSGQQINVIDTALNLSGVGDMTFDSTNINFINSPVFISGTNLRVSGNVYANNLNNLVYTTGNQSVTGNKSFYGDVLLSGSNNRIGRYHYIQTDNDFVYIKNQVDVTILSSEESTLFSQNGSPSVLWDDRHLRDSFGVGALHWNNRSLDNQLGQSLLYWTGDNIGIGTNTPTEKLTVAGNIRMFDGGNSLYIYDGANDADNRMSWNDGEIIFFNNYDSNSPTNGGVGFLFNDGPLGENVLYSYKAGDTLSTYLYIPSGRQGYIAVDSDLVNTGIILNNKINSLSGYVNFSNNNTVFTTGNQLISGTKTFDVFPVVSGNKLITGVDLSSYATTANLFITGSTLDNKINSLSGYVNSQDNIFSGQTFNTGSRLDNKINSLSGYVDSKSITLPSTIVYTTGDQIISGNKTFLNNIAVSGTGNFNNVKVSNIDKLYISGVDVLVSNMDNLFLSGVDIVVTGNSSINIYNPIYISGNPVLTGIDSSSYATISNLFSTGSNLSNKINSLSGYVNSQDILYTTKSLAIAYAIAL